MAVTGVNPVTSVGFGCADPLAGLGRLYALLRRRFAPASLRSAAQVLTKESSTLFRPACSKSISSLLPSMAAMVP